MGRPIDTSEKQDYNTNRWDRFYVSKNYRNKRQGFIPKRYSRPQMRYHHSRDELKYTRPKKWKKKKPSRPCSPDEGSEEFMTKKIQKTSAIIMRHLLSPEESIISPKTGENSTISHDIEKKPEDKIESSSGKKFKTRKRNESSVSETSQHHKEVVNFTVEGIHKKIMNYLSNLNDGRKKNLISTSTSIYDDAIQQIIKQKRLEISRALRNVCIQSSDVSESTELINSIIPDMGIRIEDLPQEFLEELRITFSNTENHESCSSGNDFSGSLESFIRTENDLEIKQEPFEVITDNVPDSLSNSIEDVINISQRDVYSGNSSGMTDFGGNHTKIENVEIIEKDTRGESEIQTGIKSLSSQLTLDHPMDNGVPGNTELAEPSSLSSIQNENTEIEYSIPHSSNSATITIEDFIQINFKEFPRDLSSAVKRMRLIDKYIAKLTGYKQKMFADLMKSNKYKPEKKRKKKKKPNKIDTSQISGDQHENERNQSRTEEVANEQIILEFEKITEQILVLKVCEDKLLAATETGNIHFFSLEDGRRTNVLNVTSGPIYTLALVKEEDDKRCLFVGSRESVLKVYNLYSTYLQQSLPLCDSVQCLDHNWGYLFLGCLKGNIMRYSIKKRSLESKDQFNSNPIMVLKATQEGARRVLLIGSRNSPIIIRDAMTSLHLRTLELVYTTVYSMIIHANFVICGTTAHDILMFNFYNGNREHTFEATNAKGVSCMKVVGKCLFASCYNGNIYVFNLETKTHEGTMCGPGGVIISMEVLYNQVVVGTMSLNFSSIPISQSILSQMS